jgi:hypothetical protein
MKSRLYAVLPVVAAFLAAPSSYAQSYLGRTQLVYPASKCAVKPIFGNDNRPARLFDPSTPGAIVYGPFLINNTGSAQEVQCPITANSSAVWEFHFASLDVSAGWATTQSCQLCLGNGDGYLWCFAPSYISHASAYRDSIIWDGPLSVGDVYGVGAEMQCGLPNGQSMRDYYVDNFLEVW